MPTSETTHTETRHRVIYDSFKIDEGPITIGFLRINDQKRERTREGIYYILFIIVTLLWLNYRGSSTFGTSTEAMSTDNEEAVHAPDKHNCFKLNTPGK